MKKFALQWIYKQKHKGSDLLLCNYCHYSYYCTANLNT